jgi:hypothetical protein
MHAAAENAENAHIVGAAGEGVHARRSCRRTTNVEVRYHGHVPRMAFWIEGSSVFKLRVPVRTYKAQYHVHNTMGFETHSGKPEGGAWGEGHTRSGASQLPVSASGHARSSSSVVMKRHPAIDLS